MSDFDKAAIQDEIDRISQSIADMEHRLRKLIAPLKERKLSLRQELRAIQMQERAVDRLSLQTSGAISIPGSRCRGYYRGYPWLGEGRCFAQAYDNGYCKTHLRNPKFKPPLENVLNDNL